MIHSQEVGEIKIEMKQPSAMDVEDLDVRNVQSAKSAAERAKMFREKKKVDAEYREAEKQRAKAYRERVGAEYREAEKQRAKAYRERRK